MGGVVALVAALIGGITYGAASLSGGGDAAGRRAPRRSHRVRQGRPRPGRRPEGRRHPLPAQVPEPARSCGDQDADLRKVLFDCRRRRRRLDRASASRPTSSRGSVSAWASRPTRRRRSGHDASRRRARSPPTVVVALQVGDEDKARAGLDRLIAASTGSVKPGYVVQDGYALLAQTTAIAHVGRRRRRQGHRGRAPGRSPATSRASTTASRRSGSTARPRAACMSVADLGRRGAARAAGASRGRCLGAVQGARVVYSLRFDGPDVLELVGTRQGSARRSPVRMHPVKGFADAARQHGRGPRARWRRRCVSTAPGRRSRSRWTASSAGGDSIDEGAVRQAERQYGAPPARRPQAAVRVEPARRARRHGLAGGNVDVGARVTTRRRQACRHPDRPAHQRVRRRLWRGPTVTHRVTDDGYVVASSTTQADRLTTDGRPRRWATSPAFRRALPDVDGSTVRALGRPAGRGCAGLATAADAADLKPIAGLRAHVHQRRRRQRHLPGAPRHPLIASVDVCGLRTHRQRRRVWCGSVHHGPSRRPRRRPCTGDQRRSFACEDDGMSPDVRSELRTGLAVIGGSLLAARAARRHPLAGRHALAAPGQARRRRLPDRRRDRGRDRGRRLVRGLRRDRRPGRAPSWCSPGCAAPGSDRCWAWPSAGSLGAVVAWRLGVALGPDAIARDRQGSGRRTRSSTVRSSSRPVACCSPGRSSSTVAYFALTAGLEPKAGPGATEHGQRFPVTVLRPGLSHRRGGRRVRPARRRDS